MQTNPKIDNKYKTRKTRGVGGRGQGETERVLRYKIKNLVKNCGTKN